MSGESDDLLYQSAGALLFADLTDNGDELDFTKDFFSDDVSLPSDLNGPSYESMGGDDFIADLGGQDVFPQLGPSELDHAPEFGVDVDHKTGLSLSSPSSHSKPFANGQILPTYGNFQKPSINLAHINTTFGSSISEMYMQRNGMTGLVSPPSPAFKSSGLLSPGATSEKLNSLSLDHQMGYSPYRHGAFDVKGNVPRVFSKGGPYSPAGVHSPSGDKRFPSSPLSSPSVQTSISQVPNSNGILPYTSAGGQDMVTNIIVSSEAMHSSSAHQSDLASPRSSSEAKDSGDGMLLADGGMKLQQTKALFLSPGLAHRLASAVDNSGFSPQVDANGDGLRPLSMAQHSSRSSAMQRSFSSHALGQLRNIAPMMPGNDQSGLFSRAVPSSRLSNETGNPHLQPQLADLHNVHGRPLMQSMRRVHSTGDIQTLNGAAAGGTSPSNFEDGGFKIGRYTTEERRIRIHRYQQKRTQRNFNKKIKYACRKTLADSRPRVRGRFAKNDEVGEPMVKLESKEEEEEEEELMYEDEELFVDEDSSGDLSEALRMNGVKVEHPASKGVKL